LAEIINGNEKQSSEGKPIWVPIKNITRKILAFDHAHKFISEYINQKNPTLSAI